MSQGSYNYTTTKQARVALALKREYTRSYFSASLPLMAEHEAPRERILSEVEQLPDFGPWAIAYTADSGVKELPLSESYFFIKVPGVKCIRRRGIAYSSTL